MPAAASILAGLSILVIGESHMIYELRDAMYDDLASKGAAQIHIVGACGASAGDWIKPRVVDCGAERKTGAAGQTWGPGRQNASIQELIAQDKPDVVVLVIGDTMGSYDKDAFPRAWAWQGVSGLTKAVAATGTQCVWVGPAYGKAGGQFKKDDAKVERLSRFLATNVAPCEYVDSLAFAAPGQWRTFDGQHFNADGYRSWSSAIVGKLEESPAVKKAHDEK